MLASSFLSLSLSLAPRVFLVERDITAPLVPLLSPLPALLPLLLLLETPILPQQQQQQPASSLPRLLVCATRVSSSSCSPVVFSSTPLLLLRTLISLTLTHTHTGRQRERLESSDTRCDNRKTRVIREERTVEWRRVASESE